MGNKSGGEDGLVRILACYFKQGKANTIDGYRGCECASRLSNDEQQEVEAVELSRPMLKSSRKNHGSSLLSFWA